MPYEGHDGRTASPSPSYPLHSLHEEPEEQHHMDRTDQGALPSSMFHTGHSMLGNLDTGVEDIDEDLRAMAGNQTLTGQAVARGNFPRPTGPGWFAKNKLAGGQSALNPMNWATGFDPTRSALQHSVESAPYEMPLAYTALDTIAAGNTGARYAFGNNE